MKLPLFMNVGSTSLLPQLLPQSNSPVLKAGLAHPFNSNLDAKNKKRQNPPTLGALEVSP